eukprot:2492819-Rhodomonas_salina.1
MEQWKSPEEWAGGLSCYAFATPSPGSKRRREKPRRRLRAFARRYPPTRLLCHVHTRARLCYVRYSNSVFPVQRRVLTWRMAVQGERAEGGGAEERPSASCSQGIALRTRYAMFGGHTESLATVLRGYRATTRTATGFFSIVLRIFYAIPDTCRTTTSLSAESKEQEAELLRLKEEREGLEERVRRAARDAKSRDLALKQLRQRLSQVS